MGIKNQVARYIRKLPLPRYEPSKLGGAIIDSMTQHPDDWDIDNYDASHRPSGLKIWIANDVSCRRIEYVTGFSSEQTKKLSDSLSQGDRIAIDLLCKQLRKRLPEVPNETDQLVALLKGIPE